MKTTPRAPKIKRAKGNSFVNVGRPIDARAQETFEAGLERRAEEAQSLAELNDLSWLKPGVLAYLKKTLFPAQSSQKGDIERLIPDAYAASPRVYAVGTPVIFSDAERRQVTNKQRGPMRIIRHVWIAPDGNKYSIGLENLQRDML